MKKPSRNPGIDLLRIISMIGVVFLHVLGHGGILTLDHSLASFSMVWFFEILAFPAVNCFVLISGYVGHKEDSAFPNIKNLLSLLFTVLFYSITIVVAFMLFGPEPISLKEVLKSFMPTLMGRYWFFTAYFGLFLLSPILNLLVSKSDYKQDVVFLIVLSLFSIISVLRDVFSLLGGFSVIWFVFMYLVGAIFKKYSLNRVFSKKTWYIIISSAFIATWLSKIVLHYTNIPFLQNCSGILIDYVSPTIIAMAVGSLGVFSNLTCPYSKTISFIATSAFSVYLIHDNFFIRKYLIAKIYTMVNDLNVVLLALSIISSVVVIFSFCILIDKIRMYLFRIIKIDRLIKCIEDIMKVKINMIYEKVRLKLQATEE